MKIDLRKYLQTATEHSSTEPTIPRDSALDGAIGVLSDGYEYIWKRCQQYRSDIFLTRLMGQPAVCVHGPEAGALFYDESKLQRHGAVPRRVVTSLFGKGAVHTLDDREHRQRKSAFLQLMTQSKLVELNEITARGWRQAIRRWEQQSAVVLFDESARVLTDAVCTWAGVPIEPTELPKRARDLTRMVDSFGGFGARLWKGKLARMRCERWIERLVRDVRRGKLSVRQDSALYILAQHRELDGTLLSPHTTAVELLNVLRPTVAVAWYIAFAALALHDYPQTRDAILRDAVDDPTYIDLFMQELRRFYPFTPYLGAKVRSPFDWRGHHFEPGTLVLLDVYGTHHDPQLWEAPHEFRPERFRDWTGDLFEFLPQGGGHHATGHRCPGEWITMHNIALAVHFLVRCATYEVAPGQNLTVDLRRLPTRPASGFVLRNVRATAELEGPAPKLPSRTAARDVAAGDARPTEAAPQPGLHV